MIFQNDNKSGKWESPKIRNNIYKAVSHKEKTDWGSLRNRRTASNFEDCRLSKTKKKPMERLFSDQLS